MFALRQADTGGLDPTAFALRAVRTIGRGAREVNIGGSEPYGVRLPGLFARRLPRARVRWAAAGLRLGEQGINADDNAC